MSIILASASPRRKELLEMLGVRDLKIVPAVGEEKAETGLPPDELVKALASHKAREVAAKCASDDIVIAADTIVWHDGRVYGKPHSEAEAAAMLRAYTTTNVNLQYDLPISFEESIFGTTKTIEIPNEKDCPDCHGTGAAAGTRRETCKQCGGTGYVTTRQAFFQMRQPCPVCRGAGTIVKTPCRTCSGSGRLRDRAKIDLHIPRGVETGTRLRVAGHGQAGTRGGRPGDLHVVLHVRESDLFERQGDDLIVEAPVPPDVAALGGDVEVPTPEGSAKIRIAPGTPDGKLYRLRGKGAPLVNGRGAGDLIVRIAIEIPAHLSSRQRKALEDLQAAYEDRSYPQARAYRDRIATFLKAKESLSR